LFQFILYYNTIRLVSQALNGVDFIGVYIRTKQEHLVL